MSASLVPIRFIHTSDWQLGMTRAFLQSEAAPRFAQARIDVIVAIGKLAEAQQASFVVVAGDVFESNQLSRQTLMRTLDALEQVSVPVFLLPGNHDPLDAASIYATPEFEAAGKHIFVIRDARPFPVPGLPGVEVVGAPWPNKRPNSDLCADLAAALTPAKGVVRVAVAHGQVDSLSPDTSRPDIISLRDAEAAIVDDRFAYLALGDRHSVTSVGSTGRIWYSGAPVATAFDEVDPNQVLLVELSAAGVCRVEPHSVGDWVFIAKQWTLNNSDDLERFAQWLQGLPDKERTVVKVGFEGSINLALASRLDGLMEAHAELFASLRWRERTSDLAILPDAFDQDSVDLAGYAKLAWNDLLVDANSGDAVALAALQLCYRLSRQAQD